MAISASGLGGFGVQSKMDPVIISCVLTVSYSILVNGKPGAQILPIRGLRQGNPLSPYLFLICREGFSSLINNAEWRRDLKGIMMRRKVLVLVTFYLRMIAFCFVEQQRNNRVESKKC